MANPADNVFPGVFVYPGDVSSATVITFTPPLSESMPSGTDRFWRRFKSYRRRSVLKFGSTYKDVEFPDDEDLTAADVVYLGGHTYIIDETEASALSAAGYSAGLFSETSVPGFDGSYGSGPYGYGYYGTTN